MLPRDGRHDHHPNVHDRFFGPWQCAAAGL